MVQELAPLGIDSNCFLDFHLGTATMVAFATWRGFKCHGEEVPLGLLYSSGSLSIAHNSAEELIGHTGQY